jgi:hypothetical protein
MKAQDEVLGESSKCRSAGGTVLATRVSPSGPRQSCHGTQHFLLGYPMVRLRRELKCGGLHDSINAPIPKPNSSQRRLNLFKVLHFIFRGAINLSMQPRIIDE